MKKIRSVQSAWRGERVRRATSNTSTNGSKHPSSIFGRLRRRRRDVSEAGRHQGDVVTVGQWTRLLHKHVAQRAGLFRCWRLRAGFITFGNFDHIIITKDDTIAAITIAIPIIIRPSRGCSYKPQQAEALPAEQAPGCLEAAPDNQG